ncbi:MAG: CvpA family protein [Firmicutes bacterium]|nr:CvpA family protein [Bacillota bacterium]
MIIIVVGYMVIKGFSRGLIREIFSLAGTLLGILLAFRYSWVAASFLTNRFLVSPAVARIVGFVIIAAGIGALAAGINFLWGQFTRRTPFSILDSFGGAGFGFIKSGVFVCLSLLILSSIPYSDISNLLRDSVVARRYLDFAPAVYRQLDRILPTDVPRILAPPRDFETGPKIQLPHPRPFDERKILNSPGRQEV